MDQSSKQFLALADRPFTPPNKPDNEECVQMPNGQMTESLRHAETDAEIAACFPVMRALRPHLSNAQELCARVRQQAKAGYRILAAWHGDEAIGLAGYRPQENLIRGPFCYVDDLVVREDQRRTGLGARLLTAVGTEARARGLPHLVLDTDLSNALGQRFYFRFGMLPVALRFGMRLG
jgi:GNAT superfamily N-acetyltransferase